MVIKINVVELSTELAHNETLKYFNDDETLIYTNTEDDMSTYSNDAQIVFDKNYDIFYDIIIKCNIS